jgi:hypothetical protein
MNGCLPGGVRVLILDVDVLVVTQVYHIGALLGKDDGVLLFLHVYL